jgi:hypothetical protein
MKNIIYSASLLMFTICLAACSNDEETMSWRAGTNLHIVGPSEVIVDAEEPAEYYVDAFTVDESYVWKLDGNDVASVRKGEFVVLEFDAPGTHTLSVSNGEHDGELEIEVVTE